MICHPGYPLPASCGTRAFDAAKGLISRSARGVPRQLRFGSAPQFAEESRSNAPLSSTPPTRYRHLFLETTTGDPLPWCVGLTVFGILYGYETYTGLPPPLAPFTPGPHVRLATVRSCSSRPACWACGSVGAAGRRARGEGEAATAGPNMKHYQQESSTAGRLGRGSRQPRIGGVWAIGVSEKGEQLCICCVFSRPPPTADPIRSYCIRDDSEVVVGQADRLLNKPSLAPAFDSRGAFTRYCRR